MEDYIALNCLKTKLSEEQKFNLWSATGFLFDDSYTFDFGGINMTLEELVDCLSSERLSVDTLRKNIKLKLVEAKKKKGLTDGL
jgi:hypothetical protein